MEEAGDDGDKKEICGTVEVPNLCEDFHDCVQDVEANVTKDDTSSAQTFPRVWPLTIFFFMIPHISNATRSDEAGCGLDEP